VIFGLTTTLEKRTRGKLVREGILLLVSFKEISFTSYSSSENTQIYLRLFFSKKIILNSPRITPWSLSQKSVQLYGIPNNKCCTNYLEICANSLNFLYGIHTRTIPQNSCQISSKTVPKKSGLYGPQNFVPSPYRLYRFSLQKIMTNRYLDLCANKCCLVALECVSTSSEL
jgi:hypothetical protein